MRYGPVCIPTADRANENKRHRRSQTGESLPPPTRGIWARGPENGDCPHLQVMQWHKDTHRVRAVIHHGDREDIYMQYIFTCECGQEMTVSDDHIGRTGQCVKCGRDINITRDRVVPLPTVPTSYPLSQEPAQQASVNESALPRKKILLAVGIVLALAITYPLVFGGRHRRQPEQPQRRASAPVTIPLQPRQSPPTAIKPRASGVRCDKFDVIANLEGDTISFRLETDLPDYTEVMVHVCRSYYEKDGTEYPINYLSEKSTVRESRTKQTVSVRDRLFQEELQERIDLMAGVAGEPFQVARIDDDIEVSFLVPVNQINPAFGAGNVNLQGTKVSKTGLRTVEAQNTLRKPLADASPTAYLPTKAHYASLEVEGRYRLSKKTPLMPELEPVDPIAAIARMRYLPPRSTIVVKQIRMKRTTAWYYVEASDPRNRHVGSGWINSLGLLGQDIDILK